MHTVGDSACAFLQGNLKQCPPNIYSRAYLRPILEYMF